MDDMGPVDYVVIEWPGEQPKGQVAPVVVDLVERGLISILDPLFVRKESDGSVTVLELDALAEQVAELRLFQGAGSGLLSDDDADEAAAALEPGTSAALLVYENRWAAPLAGAVRSSGGQLVASGRIPAPELLEALDRVEAAEQAG